MNTSAVLAMVMGIQMNMGPLSVLQLTGSKIPPPVRLQDGDKFDYIIIGAGTTGCVIATRLVQRKYNVLLIEAGDDYPYESTIPRLVPYLANSMIDWNYTTTPDGYSYQGQRNQVLDLGIGKVIGGTSELNYMVYARGHPSNYDEWARISEDPGWSWQNMISYFKKAENVTVPAIRNSKLSDLYGLDGYIGITKNPDKYNDQFLEGFRQIGKDIIENIDGSMNGYSSGLMTINNGKRQGAGRYLSKIAENRYIALAKKTFVTKILFNDNKVVDGVQLITDEGKKIKVFANQEVVLSAGAIGSPHLLLLSGIGPTKQLANFKIPTVSNLPVGQNYQDHVGTILPYKTNIKTVKSNKDPGTVPAGVIVGYQTLNKTIRQPYTNTSKPDYTVVARIFSDTTTLIEFCASAEKFSARLCNKLAEEADDNVALVVIVSDLHARSEGTGSLQSADPMVQLKVVPDSFSYDRDLNNMVDYIKDFIKVEKSTAFKTMNATLVDLVSPRCDAFKKRSREYWRCYILYMMVSLKSYSGTCSLGSVVDSRLRVYGVSGLRVADTSIMPKITGGVTCMPAIATGERAADIIIEDAGEEYNSIKHQMIRKDQIKNMPN